MQRNPNILKQQKLWKKCKKRLDLLWSLMIFGSPNLHPLRCVSPSQRLVRAPIRFRIPCLPIRQVSTVGRSPRSVSCRIWCAAAKGLSAVTCGTVEIYGNLMLNQFIWTLNESFEFCFWSVPLTLTSFQLCQALLNHVSESPLQLCFKNWHLSGFVPAFPRVDLPSAIPPWHTQRTKCRPWILQGQRCLVDICWLLSSPQGQNSGRWKLWANSGEWTFLDGQVEEVDNNQ